MVSPYYFMIEELSKMAGEDVSRSDAVQALARLKKLEDERPTPAQLSRGALAGAIVGPASLASNKLVSGGLKGALSGAAKGQGVKGKAVGVAKGLWGGTKQLGGAAAGAATFGALMPVVRGHLDREAEKDKLRNYLGENDKSTLRRASKKYLGV